MIVFAKANGTIIDVMPSPVYQGSNMSGSIYFVAPLASLNAVTVTFKLPNGILTEPYRMTLVSELDGVTDKLGEEYSVWEWQDGNAEITEYAGVCVAQFSVYLPNGKLLTTSRTSFNVEEGVPPIMPDEPTEDVYELILRYLAQLDSRTKNVPNLVASIQKVASNAFTYTNNSNVKSAPIVLTGGEEAPMPVTPASTITIPKESDGWQPIYESDETTIIGYKYIVDAALHGQMRDGATANDLWVSFSAQDSTVFDGKYADYTVDGEGNITVTVSKPIDLTMRVWNGKGLVDNEARADIQAETQRAENAEEKLQEQITELQNTGVDMTARAEIAAETERAETAEEKLQEQVDAKLSISGGVMTGDITSPHVYGADGVFDSGVRVYSEINPPPLDSTEIMFDLVIRTQEEFESFYTSIAAGTCDAYSVLFVGDGGELEFEYPNDDTGIILPTTLHVIEGVKAAKIYAPNVVCEYNSATDSYFGGGLSYRGAPTDDTYHIKGLQIRVGGQTANGFQNCRNIYDCVAYMDHNHDNATAAGYRPRAYKSCTNIYQSSAIMGSNSQLFYGFSACTNLVGTSASTKVNSSKKVIEFFGYDNCNYIYYAKVSFSRPLYADSITGHAIGFSYCRALTNCYSSIVISPNPTNSTCECGCFKGCSYLCNCGGNAVMFYNNIFYGYIFNSCSYLSNCGRIDGAIGTLWTGSNTKRDDDSCQL